MNGEFDNLQVHGPAIFEGDTKQFNCLIFDGTNIIAGIDEGGTGYVRELRIVGETTNDEIGNLYISGGKLCVRYKDGEVFKYTAVADLTQGSTTQL